MPNFKAIIEKFNGDLTEIEDNIGFIHESLKVLTRSGDVLPFVASSQAIRQMFEEFRSRRNIEVTPVYQGLFVQLYALFEWLMRELIECYVEEMNRICSDYLKLSRRRAAHFNLIRTTPELPYSKYLKIDQTRKLISLLLLET